MMEQRRAALRVVGPALAAPRCRGQPSSPPPLQGWNNPCGEPYSGDLEFTNVRLSLVVGRVTRRIRQ